MATKTFKIGLSNTDKQNMAQDIYERLIGMSFDEYDSSATYNKGDFVVYENPADTFKLYECNSDNVTGAWDSSKWDLATFQTLIDNIEDAVQFVNDKANVDGNYPTMTVGFADALTPYDEESGDDQDEPFGFQATGTGNGTQPDFATGSTALMKEKRGNTVVVNQLLKNSTFTGTTNWSANSGSTGSLTASNNIATLTFGGVSSGGGAFQLYQYINVVSGHKYILSLQCNPSKVPTGVKAVLNLYNGSNINIFDVSANTWNSLFAIVTAENTDNSECGLYMLSSEWQDNDTLQIKNPFLIDLTQWFNGDIPADLLSHPENFFRYYQGSLAYNEGTLVNANGRYVKCIGRNQWDEETEILYTDFTFSKNYIKVIPNATYYFKSGTIQTATLYFYDKDYNELSTLNFGTNNTFVIPSNCCYIKFNYYGTTYNHDITISLYYEDESGYDQYYPYEVLTNNDTGTEVLRSAGSAHDIKLPDGTIKRNVGYVDLGTLTWSYSSGVDNYFWCTPTSLHIKKSGNNSKKGNLLTAKYVNSSYEGIVNNADADKLITLDGNSGTVLAIRDKSFGTDAVAFKAAMSGIYLFYEKDEPTTEQGTPYSENLFIDDFGSMDFSGTNGVPQGNLIFYPVDYKAFIDTLYDYTEGTPSELALKSDLTDFLTETRNNNGITAETGITLDFKRLTKIGSIVFIDFVLHNSSGDAIAANTKILSLAADYKPNHTSYGLFNGEQGFELKTNGDITTLKNLSNNEYVEYHGCFQI